MYATLSWLQMDSYTRLSDAVDSPPSEFSPPFTSEYEAPVSSGPRKWWREFSKACQHALGLASEPAPTSGYLTLIPLSDDRLKPRNTKLLVAALVFVAMAAASTVFILVPRGVSAGSVTIQSDHMSWNTTKGTYQLNLLARIPITNPNFLTATVEGKLSVYFYDTEAGFQKIKALKVAPRSNPETLEVTVDASNVPNEYALTILSECAAFPRRLIFFLKGALTARYLWTTQLLSPVDTYFMIDCVNGGSIPRKKLEP